ncbi:hypothetical protein [Microvirga sp. G4-2]|uniref:hypothetical protein n=1 Tax=Microvirga sp. G4-2 TaxID=3434467 RepID=UPI004044A5E6
MEAARQEFRKRVAEYVRDHYKKENSRPLLLAELGSIITNNQWWPEDRGSQSLAELLSEPSSELQIIRDPDTPAYVAVAVPETRDLVEKAIEARHAATLLSGLAKPVLVAFCVANPSGTKVYLRTKPPFRYSTKLPRPHELDDYFVIEDEFRRPGLQAERIERMAPADQVDLARKIKDWATSKGVVVQSLMRAEKTEDQAVTVEQDNAGSEEGREAPSALPEPRNALERLYAAQEPEVAATIVIPLDLAVALSRRP